MKIAKEPILDYLVFWGTCLGYCLFLLYLFASFSPNRSLHSRYINHNVAASFYQVKWDLYTHAPFDQVNRLYSVTGNTALAYDLHPFTPRFLFGLKRDSKIIAGEVELIMADTAWVRNAIAYQISMPVQGGDINEYIRPDTMKFYGLASKNILYLKGRYLLTSEAPPDWQKMRSGAVKNKVVSVLAIDINGQR